MKRRDHFPDPTASSVLVYKRRLEVLNQYSKGVLTYPGDKLIALSGVAEKFRRYLPSDSYIAGLWKEDLRNQLLWFVAPGWKLEVQNTSPCRGLGHPSFRPR